MYRKFYCFSILLVVAAMMPFALTGTSQAEMIIHDTFTEDTNGVSLTGRMPDVANLPGDSYLSLGTIGGQGIHTNRLRTTSDSGANISMASAGTYVKPTSFGISGVLNVGTLDGSGSGGWWYVRGVGLGFYRTDSGYTNAPKDFLGLSLRPDGRLTLLDCLTDGATPAWVESLSYQGTWDAAANHTLSYWVDTTNGSMSNVVLDGVSYSFAATTIFTDAKTNNTGFYGSSNSGNENGYMDDFSVVAIPEPGTLALLATGLIGLLCYAWRKRK